MDLYTLKYLELISLTFIILGGIHLGIMGILNRNYLQIISKYTFKNLEKIIYIIIGICAIVNIFSRDYYLPFLGDTVYPCGSLVEKIPINANLEVFVHTPPHSNVIYWAAESSKSNLIIESPLLAYGENTNAGVTKADGKGLTVLKVRIPSGYKTPNGILLKPHVHYRVCTGHGMLSRVETVFINSGNTKKIK